MTYTARFRNLNGGPPFLTDIIRLTAREAAIDICAEFPAIGLESDYEFVRVSNNALADDNCYAAEISTEPIVFRGRKNNER